MIGRKSACLLVLLLAPGSGTWSVEDSTEVLSRLEEAERLFRKGLRAEAVPLLQEILDRFPDHLVKDPKDPLRFEGAREVVLRILREGPPETRRAYEEFAGPRAEAALAKGCRTGDAAGLDRDARRYGMAGPAGPRLLLAAADLRLARGEPGRAAASLRTLLRDHAGKPEAGPAAAARLARALSRTGDRAGIVDLRRTLAAEGEAKVRAGGGTTTLAAILDEALAAAGPAPRPADTPMLGGAPDRRGAGLAAEPLGPPRWVQGNGRFGWTQRDFEQMGKEPPVAESLQRAEPVAAALVDGILYYHWSLEVVARDLYTGRERWRYRAPAVPRIEKARTHGSLLTCPAVVDGVVYAPLQVWPEGEVPREIVFADQVIIPHIPVRRLFALDAASGKVLWSHRDAEAFGPALRGPLRLLNITSPPLVLGDLVIGAGAVAPQGAGFDAWCIAADRRTGEIRWTSRLGSGQQELNLFGRKVKEVPVAAVASDGRRLFVQTNMGFVSCLDPSTGLPLWTRAYRQTDIPFYDNFWTTPERKFTWTGSPPISAGGLLLAAPADGEDLLALRADTGRLEWLVPGRDSGTWDGPHMYRLLGADEERAYVAGRPSVRAFDLRTGKLSFEFPFPGAARMEASAGRGIVADGKLVVPSNRAVYVLDTRNRGALLRADPFGDPRSPMDRGGNLVVAEGASALLRLEEVEAYFRPEDVRIRAQALLRDRPGNVDALLEAARIYLAADRPGDALPLLEQALRAVESLPEPDRDGRRREVRASMAAVKERAAAALAAEGKAVAARDAFLAAAHIAPDAATAAAILLRGARTENGLDPVRLDLAAALVEALLGRYGDAVLEDETQLLGDEPGRCTAASYALWNLSLWQAAEGNPAAAVESAQRIVERPATDLLFGDSARRIARALIDDHLRTHGPGVYAPFERQAAEALERARARKDAPSLSAVAERWPNARAAVRASLEEARLRLEGGDAALVVATLRRLLAGDIADEDAAEALWLLAEGLVRSGKAASARATLQRLARRHPKVPVPHGNARLPAAEAVALRLQAPDMKSPSAPPAGLPAGTPWKELWRRTMPMGEVADLLVPPGDPLPGGKAYFVRGPVLEAVEAATGATAWRFARPEFRGIVTSASGVLVFARDESAVGIDPSTGEEIWRAPLSGSVEDAVAVDSLVVLLLVDPSNQDSGRLTALDPATGERAWPAEVLLPGGAGRLAARAGAVLCDGTGTAFSVIRVVESVEGKLLPGFIPLRRGGESPAEALEFQSGPVVLRRENSLEAWDPAKGTMAWTWVVPENARIASSAAGEGWAAVLDEKGTLHGVDVAKGREAWSAPPGRNRIFDPSTTAIAADGKAVYAVTMDAATQGGTRLEARGVADGALLWSAPICAGPVLIEVAPAAGSILVKYLSTGTSPQSRTGIAVVEAAGGSVLDRFEDPDAILGGLGFEAAPVSGTLVLTGDRTVIVRGR